MKLIGHYKDYSYDEQGNINLSFSIFGKAEVLKAKQLVARLMKKDNLLDIEVKQHKKKRSLDSNAYAWKLITELSKKLKVDKGEIYKSFILELSICKTMEISNNAFKTFKTMWTSQGIGWIVEIVDQTEHTTLNAYYGSSVYNTKQMSQFIELIVNECKLNGIETKTPQELAELNSQWAKEK